MADNSQIIPPPIAGGLGPNSSPSGRPQGIDYRQLSEPAQGVPSFALGRDAEGIGREAQELGNVFREFEDTAASVGNKFAAQAGAKAGAAAGAAGNGKPLTGLQSITAYGAAYDSAVHQTYITQSQLSLENSLTGLEQAHTGDPVGFQAAAGKVAQAAIEKADPLYQPELTQWANARIMAGTNRQRDQATNDARNE